MKTRLFIVTALIFITVLICWITGVFVQDKEMLIGQSESSTEVALRVITRKVTFSSNDVHFEALGTGRASSSIEVFPAVAEQVERINFKAGQFVEKGDLLVQLEDDAEILQVNLAEVQLREARRLLERYELAVKDGGVPQSDVDSARASVEAAEVQLEQARLAVRDRKIVAPFRGVVGIARVDPGERVTTSTLITGLDDRERLLVDFKVPEMLLGALNVGQTLTLSTPAFPGKTFEGRVLALESRIDDASRTVLTRAEIANKEDLLRPGQSFSIVLKIPGEKYPSVPEIATQWGNDGAYIWLVRDGRAVRTRVFIIARFSGRVLVKGAIQESEEVVVEGLQRLQDGSVVISQETRTGVSENQLPGEVR